MVAVIISKYVASRFLNREVRALSSDNGLRIVLKNMYSHQRWNLEELSEAPNMLNKDDDLLRIVKFNMDKEIVYSSLIESYKFRPIYYDKKQILHEIKLLKDKEEFGTNNMPIILKKLIDDKVSKAETEEGNADNESISEQNFDHKKFPFASFEDINVADIHDTNQREDYSESDIAQENQTSVKDDIAYRLKTYSERRKRKLDMQKSELDNDSDIYEDSLIKDISSDKSNALSKHPSYGTPDPQVKQSSVPCGGCGAILHCQDESLPGYIPSELFRGKNRGELRSSLCQRCFFLETYDVAINVRISPEVYEKCLQPIINDKALVIVVLDVTDVPCSIWPGLFNILGPKRPVVIVGNKVDLLPPDSSLHLINVKKSLINSLRDTNLTKHNIKHVALTSAKTGYGIEDLISRIQLLWGTKGNIYIVGCTNSGKSTLFNALLGSDMCQSNATDLIRRATASPWPGTTLNLLKFPLIKPTGERVMRRKRRLEEEKAKINDLNTPPPKRGLTVDYTEATLRGHIGRTFRYDVLPKEVSDPFTVNDKRARSSHLGINESSYIYSQSKWLFDTPGTVQPDQLLGLLSHEELLLVLPKTMIEPRTFSIWAGHTLFIGGIARLDILHITDKKSIRLTVFSSSYLPVTIVKTVDASSVYRRHLGSDLLVVPRGGEARLRRWPAFKPTNIFLINNALEGESCSDIVLSSAGFVTITGEEEMEFRAWTPGGRGVYVRDPPMLPKAVKLKGNRIKGTPAFHRHKVYIPSHYIKE